MYFSLTDLQFFPLLPSPWPYLPSLYLIYSASLSNFRIWSMKTVQIVAQVCHMPSNKTNWPVILRCCGGFQGLIGFLGFSDHFGVLTRYLFFQHLEIERLSCVLFRNFVSALLSRSIEFVLWFCLLGRDGSGNEGNEGFIGWTDFKNHN